jgi:SWI/SNF-related matrix-associated actin-dependent regulator of chromatin subfamily A-like protein 1
VTLTEQLLKPYQERGARWLAERARALLGDEPGLGKTRIALAAAAFRGFRRILIFGPAIARAAWEREFDVLLGLWAPSEQPIMMFVSFTKFVISGTTRDEIALFAPEVVIIDEFHNLKHVGAQRTQFVIGSKSVLAPPVMWGLSGTPIPRNPVEIYPIARAFWPKEMYAELGIQSLYAWREKFSVWRVGLHNRIKVYGARNIEPLRAFFRGRMLRRKTTDVLPDLPPIRWSVLPMTVPAAIEKEAAEIEAQLPEAERAYWRRDDEAAAWASPTGEASRARHALGDLKAPIAAELIAAELDREDEGSKRVVFAYHRSVLDVLEKALDPYGLVRVDGDSNVKERASAEREFQENPLVRVFLGQTEAAGVSITLTAAHRLDLVEPDWRTDLNLQAGKRIHRIGQEHSAWVRMFSMADTLDEAIVRQHHREVAMIGKVFE